MQDIERVIRESEYHVTWQDQTVLPDLEAAWHATNRAQNLRFYFTDDGLRVVDRTADGSPELLRLAVLGRVGGDTNPAILEAIDNRLEINCGGFTERYVNDEGGLWHLFRLVELGRSAQRGGERLFVLVHSAGGRPGRARSRRLPRIPGGLTA